MNSEFSPTPQEELEAQITALLLGELPKEEATALLERIAADPELRKLHMQIGMTIGLVKEAIASPQSAEIAAPEGLRLSEERREKLLASFKVVKVPEREFGIDFKTWGALAAMIAVLLTFSYWMMGAFFVKARHSTLVAVKDSGSSPPRTEMNRSLLAPPAPATQSPSRILTSRSAARENAPQDVRFRIADAEIPSASETLDPARIDVLENRGFAGPKPEDATVNLGRFGGGNISNGQTMHFYDSDAGQANAAAAEPAASSSTLAFGVVPATPARPPEIGLKDLEQNEPTQMENLWAHDGVITGQPVPDLNLIPDGTVQLGGEFQISQQKSERSVRDFDRQQLGEREIVLNPNYDVAKAKAITERLEISGAQADRFQDLEQLKKAPAGSVTAGVEIGLQNDPLAYYRKNPELMKRYFPHLAGANQAQQQLPMQLEGASGGLPVLGEIEKLRRDVETQKQESVLAKAKGELQKLEAVSKVDAPVAKPVANAPVPQPEVAVDTNPFSTFSLNVSDVSFKLAAASLEKGVMPEPAGIRSEEFINAFDYRDPTAISAPIAFAWERARYPFAHDRDLLRFSVKTAASGREAGRPLNLVLLLDSSGSMERADRVRIIRECLRVLAGQLQAQDKVSVVTFARTPRLWVDGLPGSSAGELVTRMGTVTPEGGTNLEEAMRAGYEAAARHFIANGVNRVVLLTDGAANLGEVNAESLKKRVEENRKKGIALDCFGIGWEGLNDDLLEQLSRNGDGRYGFVNTPEAASAEFAGQLAGALKVAASDVKVQVEFNPKRASAYRQIGYAKHQLTQEQFRDNSVDAAEIGASEAGNALYVVQTNPAGEGPIATVRVRFKVPGTNDYREHEWPVPYEGAAKPLEYSNPGIRLAAAASGFSEWLAASPYAGEITPDRLLGIISNVPEAFPNDPRPKQLEWMIRQAKSIAGK